MNKTQKAYENFQLSSRKVHPSLIRAIITVKSAAIQTMKDLELIDSTKADGYLDMLDRLAKIYLS